MVVLLLLVVVVVAVHTEDAYELTCHMQTLCQQRECAMSGYVCIALLHGCGARSLSYAMPASYRTALHWQRSTRLHCAHLRELLMLCSTCHANSSW